MTSLARALDSPKTLFKRLTLISIFSTLIILVAAGYSISVLYENHVVTYARKNAVSLGEALVSSERENLLTKFGLITNEPVTNNALRLLLDNSLHSFLGPYNILKIKVFSASGKILYSTDHSIIGHDDSNNSRLNNALSGAIDAQISAKDQMQDLAHEVRFDVDVVETYVPIRDKQNKIIGAFEIYQDMSDEKTLVRRGVILSMMMLGGILLVVYISAFSLLRSAAARLIATQEELARLATVDPATNVLNRREVLHRAASDLELYHRNRNTPECTFGLLMVDIDHFKSINDTYGHLIGDEALKQVAECLNSSIPPECYVGRYGGEEFMVALPVCLAQTAEETAHRLLNRIRNLPIQIGQRTLNLTISIGVATTQTQTLTFEELLHQADTNLYAAKAAGRDCYVHAPDTAKCVASVS